MPTRTPVSPLDARIALLALGCILDAAQGPLSDGTLRAPWAGGPPDDAEFDQARTDLETLRRFVVEAALTRSRSAPIES